MCSTHSALLEKSCLTNHWIGVQNPGSSTCCMIAYNILFIHPTHPITRICINTLCSLRIFIFNHGELSYFHSWPLMLEWVFWFSPQKKVFAPRYLNWEGIRCAFVGLLDHPTCKTILILCQNIFALLFGDGLPLPMKETTPLRVSFCPLWKNFKSHALNIFCRI